MSKPARQALVLWLAAMCLMVVSLFALLGAPGGVEGAGESLGRVFAHTGIAALTTWLLARRKTPEWSWLKFTLVYAVAIVIFGAIANFRSAVAADSLTLSAEDLGSRATERILDRHTSMLKNGKLGLPLRTREIGAGNT